MKHRNFIRQFVPPIVGRLAKQLFPGPIRYEGPFDGWEAARNATGGYADASILERVRASTCKVLEGAAVFEQDGMAFDECPPVGPALTGMLLAAAMDSGELRVLDFGGSLGSHYLRWRQWLAAVPSVEWRVVEQAAFVAAGRELSREAGLALEFDTSLGDLADYRPNSVLASGVLPYLPDPMATLGELVALGARVIVLDRTPFARDDVARILVQRVAPPLYRASYPLWTLSWSGTAAILGEDYELLHEFMTADAPILLRGAAADLRGSIWLRRQGADSRPFSSGSNVSVSGT